MTGVLFSHYCCTGWLQREYFARMLLFLIGTTGCFSDQLRNHSFSHVKLTLLTLGVTKKDLSLSMKYFLFSQPGLPTRVSSWFFGSNRLIRYLPNLLSDSMKTTNIYKSVFLSLAKKEQHRTGLAMAERKKNPQHNIVMIPPLGTTKVWIKFYQSV